MKKVIFLYIVSILSLNTFTAFAGEVTEVYTMSLESKRPHDFGTTYLYELKSKRHSMSLICNRNKKGAQIEMGNIVYKADPKICDKFRENYIDIGKEDKIRVELLVDGYENSKVVSLQILIK